MFLLNVISLLIGAAALIGYFVFRSLKTKDYWKKYIKTILLGALCFGVYLLGYLILAMVSSGQYSASESSTVGLLFVAALAVSLVLTELVRYLLMRPFLQKEESDPYVGFQFGAGFAAAEYLVMFFVPSILTLRTSKTSLFGAAVVILVHVLLQIMGSATAYAWLKKERLFGFFTAHLPYYAVILLSYLLSNGVAQGIVFAVLLAVAAALCWMSVDEKDFREE